MNALMDESAEAICIFPSPLSRPTPFLYITLRISIMLMPGHKPGGWHPRTGRPKHPSSSPARFPDNCISRPNSSRLRIKKNKINKPSQQKKIHEAANKNASDLAFFNPSPFYYSFKEITKKKVPKDLLSQSEKKKKIVALFNARDKIVASTWRWVTGRGGGGGG